MPNFESDPRPPYLDSLANYPVSDIYVPFFTKTGRYTLS